ncbi:MAG: hypothetical protein KBS62_02005 [Oscillospiraceae bacterium]|nr:hypothetical protein [Candidatus Ruminococcus equi]
MHYYDPMFYICSNEMPFGIRVEVTLKYEINPNILEKAVNTAIKRYPYFAIKLAEKDRNIITLQQGFSSDIYYSALIKQLKENDIEFIEDGRALMNTPDIILP